MRIRLARAEMESSVIPIVFYNGADKWTAIQELKDYQIGGGIFGEYVLNLKYYLINLKDIDEEYILNTNTVIDNMMYCDKYRSKTELISAVQNSLKRAQALSSQEREAFYGWMEHILLAACGESKYKVEEIRALAMKEDEDMAFRYNLVKMIEAALYPISVSDRESAFRFLLHES